MTVATQLEILDLRHFSARQLRPLLEEEARVWKRRLRWNYEASIEILLQYLDSRILPGFVAVDRGRVCGFTFCVYEGPKAVVGDVYAVGDGPLHGSQIVEVLLGHLLDLLHHSPGVQRIESQMLLYDSGAIEKSFLGAQFAIHPRLFMEYDRNSVSSPVLHPAEALGQVRIPDFIELNHWKPACYQSAAELIHSAYSEHVDSSINDQYRSLHGSLRFLHNIVRFPGCGVFEASSSWVLRDTRTDTLVGMLLCSRVAPDVGHITQICVAETYRKQGLGRAMMELCLGHMESVGITAITLTVTEANRQAVQLYESLGFTVRHRFDAMVKDTSSTRRGSLALRG